MKQGNSLVCVDDAVWVCIMNLEKACKILKEPLVLSYLEFLDNFHQRFEFNFTPFVSLVFDNNIKPLRIVVVIHTVGNLLPNYFFNGCTVLNYVIEEILKFNLADTLVTIFQVKRDERKYWLFKFSFNLPKLLIDRMLKNFSK